MCAHYCHGRQFKIQVRRKRSLSLEAYKSVRLIVAGSYSIKSNEQIPLDSCEERVQRRNIYNLGGRRYYAHRR